jgi:hypothetical protein
MDNCGLVKGKIYFTQSRKDATLKQLNQPALRRCVNSIPKDENFKKHFLPDAIFFIFHKNKYLWKPK